MIAPVRETDHESYASVFISSSRTDNLNDYLTMRLFLFFFKRRCVCLNPEVRKHGVCESENASTWQDSLARSLADSADVCITLHAPKPCIASMEDEGSFAFRQAR